MVIERELVADTFPVLRLSGELDLRNVPEVRKVIREYIDQGNVHIIINLSSLEFIDSSGLGVLVGGLARVREKDGVIKLSCNNPRILRVFEMTRLTQLFDIYETEEEALETLTLPGQGNSGNAA